MLTIRPLNVHPDIWKLRQKNVVVQKKIQLDDYTKLSNSIDMIVQALQIFKNTYNNMKLQEYLDKQTEKITQINNIVDCALIPYTIDIVKKFNSINIQDGQNE